MFTQTQARFFHEQGYLVARGLIDAPLVEAARQAAEPRAGLERT